MKQPHQYTKRLLLLVSGMSPQIVTETLYALTQVSAPAFVPTEIHLITTTIGADQARLNLLEGPGHFGSFCATYGLDPATFPAANIHIIRDAKGRELSDIRSPAENEATADFITEQVLKLTTEPDTALHVSIAGGRKTMGYYAGYALSLFGRMQDRLSHVLVSDGYEGLPDFYYPTPKPHTIYNRNEKALDASRAKVSLAEIPFVRLREGLPPSLLDGGHGFSKTVALARQANAPITLVIHPAEKRYRINGITEKLTPVQMVLLLWAAYRRDIQQPIESLVEGDKQYGYAKELISLADDNDLMLNGKTVAALERDGVTKAFLETNSSKLNAQLKKHLGPELASRCKFSCSKYNGRGSYDLPPDIHIEIE